MSDSDDSRNNNARREAAREKAKSLRDAHRKKEKRNRRLIQGGVGVGVLVILTVVALVLFNSVTPASAGPQNMRSDGITVGKGFSAERTDAIPRDGQPVPTTRNKKSSVVSIRIYSDFYCSVCGKFFAANDKQISSWLNSGAATVEFHPISFLDRESLGSQYSTRAANAAACVANFSPDDYWAFTQAMYAKEPKQGTTGLSNAQILKVLQGAPVQNMAPIVTCVNKERFKSWVNAASNRARTGPLPDSNVATVDTPPVIIVDGLQYIPSSYSSASDFQTFVFQAAGASFTPATSSPTPTPTPSPTATK